MPLISVQYCSRALKQINVIFYDSKMEIIDLQLNAIRVHTSGIQSIRKRIEVLVQAPSFRGHL